MAEPHSSAVPPVPPKESVTRRYKFIWRVLLISNLALGAYMFARPKKKDADVENNNKKAMEKHVEDSKAKEEEVDLSSLENMTIYETPTPPSPVTQHVKVREPIPEDQQRELFKWMLEEKRKVKPKDPEEKKRIDEDKSILKQFIRAKTIPKI